MQKDSKILITGSTGLVGSAIVRELQRKGYGNLITPPRQHFDLRIQDIAYRTVGNIQPEYVFNCSAHSGGISEAIEKPAEMLCDNLYIQANVIEACRRVKVKKLLNFASSCIYPVNGSQPYKEEQIGEGKTDENWSYAVAKIAGIEMCRAYHKQYGCNFMTVVPCNVYGINDNFGENGHVIPSLIRKFHDALESEKNTGYGSVWVWGKSLHETKRQFLYSDDLAKACIMLMDYNYNDLHDGVINVAPNRQVRITSLVRNMASIIDTEKRIRVINDDLKPSGIRTKKVSVKRIDELGWKPEISLEEGIKTVYEWYKERN